MKLIEALDILKAPLPEDAAPLAVYLACGITPLHTQTFLAAELRKRLPKRAIQVETGLFGDVAGNIKRLSAAGFHGLAVIIEWSDLDPRLGIRTLGGWRPDALADIVSSARRAAERIKAAIAAVAAQIPAAVSLPTLPMPPLFWTSPSRAGNVESALYEISAGLASDLSAFAGVEVVNPELLAELSPHSERYDLKSDVSNGYPYTLRHASALAGCLADLVERRAPKKGIITDLDDTLWAGILGEEGVDGISWSLDRHTHMHGLYQQFLASLAGAGVLVAVASKNDPALVAQAFERSDLLIGAKDIFPMEAHWSAKSQSVGRILSAWNVGADSVIFLDDSPMELAEVKAAHPEVECLLFPKNDWGAIYRLLRDLRRSFGKPFLTGDDALRLESIRNAHTWRESAGAGDSLEELLRSADASMVFNQPEGSDTARVFELVNKTNQFNLNGRRYDESQWRALSALPGAFIVSVSYKDKFGPLGTIAAIAGRVEGTTVHVSCWVMSCRAFARRIEHQCLQFLFDTTAAEELIFDFESTPRNGPAREFFEQLLGEPSAAQLHVSRRQFAGKCPALYHKVEGAVIV